MLNEKHKEFIKILERLAGRLQIVDVFSDVCATLACGIEQLSPNPLEREERFASVVAKYNADERRMFTQLFACVVEALELRRESFLGPLLEEIGASNTRNGQFLTPVDLAKLMGRICSGPTAAAAKHRPGELVTLNDPACGAGVLMIQTAEELVQAGVPKRDIYIICGDIDLRACDMTFIELSLLGYAARIEHEDALSMKEYSRPRYTPGYFLYGTQWRENFKHTKKEM